MILYIIDIELNWIKYYILLQGGKTTKGDGSEHTNIL